MDPPSEGVPINNKGGSPFRMVKKKPLVASVFVAVAAIVAITVVVVKSGPQTNGQVSSASGTGPITPAPSVSISPSISPQPTSSPSISPAPTQEPSASPTATPTAKPSAHPSLEPTISIEPSLEPSVSPSQAPSYVPSTSPSVAPTISNAPTEFPTLSPSAEPTEYPTVSPSASPTISNAPSYGPIDPDFEFRLKLHWQKSYFWQESKREERYCLECMQCTRLNFDQFPPPCRRASCRHKRQLWIWDCGGGRGEAFVVRYVGDYIQLKLADEDLCMTRYDKKIITIEDCDRDRKDQQWKPITRYGRFTIEPARRGRDDERDYCVTQHHHPKNGEPIGFHNCGTAYRHETVYWNAYRL